MIGGKNLYDYKLKLTVLSPIHIGTGEVYEPTNFVIAEQRLYGFDEVLFYKSLNELDRKSLDSKLNHWMQIIDFYKTKTEEAKKISNFHCVVRESVKEKYLKIKNADNSKIKNQFLIDKTFKNPNTHRAIIPGSSIKGMLNTVLGIYAPKEKENELRQKLLISDALLLDGGVEIGHSYRVHKIPNKEAKSEIPQIAEIIKPNSTFICHIKTEFTFEKLKQHMTDYKKKRTDSPYEEDSESFVARVGKYCGKEYMIDDIKNAINSYSKPIATHTIYEKEKSQFGWIKFERISDDEYQKSLKEISNQEKSYYEELAQRQKEIHEAIETSKKQTQEEAFKKEQKKIKEEQEREDALKAEAQKLSQMSPLEKKIEELRDKDKSPLTTLLLNNVKNGELEAFREEAIVMLEKLMRENGLWKEKSTAKNKSKDKEYQRTLEIIKLKG